MLSRKCMLARSILLFFIGSLNIIIGLIVLLRDYRKLQNRLFFLFAFALGGWVVGIGAFLATTDSGSAFLWAKLYYSFPLMVAVAMPLFSRSFPYNDGVPRKIWLPILL